VEPRLTSSSAQALTPEVSIGIIAWNEEEALPALLESLLRQSIFTRLAERGQACEILCVANGCTDHTAEVATRTLNELVAAHPARESIRPWVAELSERGKLNAWNQFAHSLSARSARVLFLMDADIQLHKRETLASMLELLEQHPEVHIGVDLPRKHLDFKQRKSLREKLSLAASRLTTTTPGQLCAQLYCIRAAVARNIYMPRDLSACDDGYIKWLVCTDFLTAPCRLERLQVAPGAEHTFEAYTSPAAIFRNQKRQIIGQTIVHILIDQELATLPVRKRKRLADTLRQREHEDPAWLKRRIHEHLGRTPCFWRLYPGLLGQRFQRLRSLPLLQRVKGFPAAAAATATVLAASFAAYRTLKHGATQYLPPPKRLGLPRAAAGGDHGLASEALHT
jgi:hypothetical protein